jgi:hypothetical protein
MAIVRRFSQPRRAVAVVRAVEWSDLPPADLWPEPTDYCWTVFVPRRTNDLSRFHLQNWISPTDQPDSPPTVIVERDEETLRWRPGKAVVQCPPQRQHEILDLLADFAFYEGELRSLETGVEAREAQAQTDVAIAYCIEGRDQRHWSRFTDCIKDLAQIRLAYARLEPQLAKPSRSLPSNSRRIMSALLQQADVEARLTALNDRLEVLEDLYEGANDRVVDYRWYRRGILLEIGIVILLLIETVIIGIDLYIRHLR